MRKVMALTVCAAMLSTMAAGCGSPGGGAPSQGEGNASAKGAQAQEETYTIKLGYTPGSIPKETSPDIMYAETFKELVETNSGGTLKVELYPSGQLGSAQEVTSGIVAGNIEMGILDISMFNNLYEPAQVLSTPGIFRSVEECDAVLAGPWGQEFMKAAKDKTGARILNMHCKGFRCFTTSSKELKTPEDAKGVTFRVMENPVSIKMVEALGAKAVPMPGSEMYVAMQNGVVDGQENPVINIVQDKTYEVQKYCVLDEHMAGIMGYVMNAKFYDKLSDAQKQVIDDAAAQCLPKAQEVIAKETDKAIQTLKDQGMSVYEPSEEEKSAWHEKILAPCEAYVRGELGDEAVDGLLDAIDAERE